MKLYYLISLIVFINFLQADPPKIEEMEGIANEQSIIFFGELPQFEDETTEDDRLLRHMPMPIPDDLPVLDGEKFETFSVTENQKPYQPLFASPTLSLSFEALNDSLVTIPPDTQGTVGINYVVTTLNDRVRVQTKAGLTLFTTSLASFAGISGTGSSPFDPKIVFDPVHNRWIFTALTNAGRQTSQILLAVSQTENPLGAWNRYTIKADPTATSTSGVWADFPSLGFNGKWIVIQTNMFNISNSGFNRSHVYVFNKTSLYANGPGTFKLFTLTGMGGTQTPAVTYDSNNPTLYLLQNWNGNASGRGYLLLYAINGSQGSETFSINGFASTASTWASSHPLINGGFAPQLGTTRRIMNNDSRILGLVFRNGSLWAAQTAFLPATSPTRSAIQWWQIAPSGSVQQFGRIEDASGSRFFAFPSIAVSIINNVLIGYSFFSPTIFASSGFSYRAANDFPNTMRATSVLRSGRDIYTKDFGSGRVRWGDYSSTVIDPNGQDFWTLQESAGTRTATGTTRWVTWWGRVLPN